MILVILLKILGSYMHTIKAPDYACDNIKQPDEEVVNVFALRKKKKSGISNKGASADFPGPPAVETGGAYSCPRRESPEDFSDMGS